MGSSHQLLHVLDGTFLVGRWLLEGTNRKFSGEATSMKPSLGQTQSAQVQLHPDPMILEELRRAHSLQDEAPGHPPASSWPLLRWLLCPQTTIPGFFQAWLSRDRINTGPELLGQLHSRADPCSGKPGSCAQSCPSSKAGGCSRLWEFKGNPSLESGHIQG